MRVSFENARDIAGITRNGRGESEGIKTFATEDAIILCVEDASTREVLASAKIEKDGREARVSFFEIGGEVWTGDSPSAEEAFTALKSVSERFSLKRRMR